MLNLANAATSFLNIVDLISPGGSPSEPEKSPAFQSRLLLESFNQHCVAPQQAIEILDRHPDKVQLAKAEPKVPAQHILL